MEGTAHLQIKQINDFKYYVIQFLKLPHEDINEIVCVPWMWIVEHRARDPNVVVSYPVENPSDTEKRVKEREKHLNKWNKYKAVVRHAHDSYEVAKNLAAEKMNEIYLTYNQCSNTAVWAGRRLPDHESSARVQGGNTNILFDKSLELVLTSENDDRPALKRFKVVESAEAFNRPNENQSSPAVGKFSNSSVEPRIVASREFFMDFFTLLRDLHTTPAKDAAMIGLLRETLIQNAETMRKASKSNVDTRASLASSTVSPKESTSKGTSAEIEKKKQDDGDDEDHDVVNGKRKPKLVLPPEYDENDSRWTLKHRELEPRLAELLPKTNVYIDAVKFFYCKSNAKDSNELARMLLIEIFTESALRVCSFTGARARAHNTTFVRPGLDEKARTAIIKFVQDFGDQRGWSADTRSIQHSIYLKMHAMRTNNNVIV